LKNTDLLVTIFHKQADNEQHGYFYLLTIRAVCSVESHHAGTLAQSVVSSCIAPSEWSIAVGITLAYYS